jgi:hypothetical protein
VNPALATISALLVEGIDSTPVQSDISALFALTATGATADVTLASEGRTFLSVNLDENADGNAEDFKTATFERFAVTDPLEVTTLSPSAAAPGDVVTLYGSGLCPNPAENQLMIGGVPGVVHAATDTFVSFVVPDSTGDEAVLAVGSSQITVAFQVDAVLAPPTRDATDYDLGFIDAELIVGYADGLSEQQIAQLAETYGVATQQFFPALGYHRAIIVGLSHEETAALADLMSADPGVEFVSRRTIPIPDAQIVSPVEPPPVPPALWHLDFAHIPWSWANNVFPKRGWKVPIAVIDSGLSTAADVTEASNGIIADHNRLKADPENWDDAGCRGGHGTLVSSMAASHYDFREANPVIGFPEIPEIGGVGVAPEAPVIPVQYFGADRGCNGCDGQPADTPWWHVGDPPLLQLDRVLEHVLQQGVARVINVSIGDPNRPKAFWTRVLDTQYTMLRRQGKSDRWPVIVNSAGNDRSQPVGTIGGGVPSQAPKVISVGGIAEPGSDGTIALWNQGPSSCPPYGDIGSNYGEGLDVVAPGANLPPTAVDGQLAAAGISGTSLAAPQVAGLAALVLAEFPGLAAREVRQRIEDLFVRPPDEGFILDSNASHGLGGTCVDYPAVEQARKDACESEFGKGLIDAKRILNVNGPWRVVSPALPATEFEKGVKKTGTWMNYRGGRVRITGDGDGEGSQSCVLKNDSDHGAILVSVCGPQHLDCGPDGQDPAAQRMIDYGNSDGCLSPSETDVTHLFTDGPGIYRVYIYLFNLTSDSTTVSSSEVWIEAPGFAGDWYGGGCSVEFGSDRFQRSASTAPVEMWNQLDPASGTRSVGGFGWATSIYGDLSALGVVGQVDPDDPVRFAGTLEIGDGESVYDGSEIAPGEIVTTFETYESDGVTLSDKGLITLARTTMEPTDTLLSAGFEDDTVGSEPRCTMDRHPAGDAMTGWAPSPSQVVVESYQDGKRMRIESSDFDYTGVHLLPSLKPTDGDPLQTGSVEVKLRAFPSTGITRFSVADLSSVYYSSELFFEPFVYLEFGPTSVSAYAVGGPIGTLPVSGEVSIRLVVNLDESRVQVFANGLSLGDEPSYASPIGFGRLVFDSWEPSSLAVDDIEVTWTP